MAGYRKEKLEALIKREVGNLLLKEIKDQRIGFVSISRVELSKDYSVAEVYYSVLGDEKQRKNAEFGLASAKGFIRKSIGKQLKMRTLPDIVFKYDDSIESGVGLVNLIEKVNKESSSFDDESDDSAE